MNEITYRAIGIIRSPFKEPKGVPIQPSASEGIVGTVETFPEYTDGLKDLEGFSHIILIYHFHLSEGYSLRVIPYMDDEFRGVFSTHAPRRPNPIGLSVVRLLEVNENILSIKGLDVVDGTPLLDIKPYVPEFEVPTGNIKIGWLEKRVHRLKETKDDGRFARKRP